MQEFLERGGCIIRIPIVKERIPSRLVEPPPSVIASPDLSGLRTKEGIPSRLKWRLPRFARSDDPHCRCEDDEVSRSNLVGLEIAALRIRYARNDRREEPRKRKLFCLQRNDSISSWQMLTISQ